MEESADTSQSRDRTTIFKETHGHGHDNVCHRQTSERTRISPRHGTTNNLAETQQEKMDQRNETLLPELILQEAECVSLSEENNLSSIRENIAENLSELYILGLKKIIVRFR